MGCCSVVADIPGPTAAFRSIVWVSTMETLAHCGRKHTAPHWTMLVVWVTYIGTDHTNTQ